MIHKHVHDYEERKRILKEKIIKKECHDCHSLV